MASPHIKLEEVEFGISKCPFKVGGEDGGDECEEACPVHLEHHGKTVCVMAALVYELHELRRIIKQVGSS